MAAGVLGLAAFFVWERMISRPRRATGNRQPLVDLGLFRSSRFTWGTVLSTLVSFALFGLVFAMPQYFLDVRGLNSLGSGLRMLPMIGGLAVGLFLGQRLQAPRKRGAEGSGGSAESTIVNPKILVTAGFAIMGAALAVGAGTSIGSSTGFAATWFAVTGFGLGIAMPTALNAAIGALSPARSGSGSALITAMRQVGGTIGVAVLGTVLATVYRSHLDLAGLPAAAASAIKQSVAAGVATAKAAGSQPLLDGVRIAYVHGLDNMLWVCSGIAIASAVLALAFLPARATAPAEPADEIGAPAGPQTSVLDKSRMTT